MARSLPAFVDTLIIGNGPSALILSYILHGNIPYYVGRHHDSILDSKLRQSPNLVNLTPDLHAHFLSSLQYSTQALPINTLLDTLIRPNADTELNPVSCVEWRRDPTRAISHVAIGESEHAGGQWAETPASASAHIGTLSYAEQLSLPGYSYADHIKAKNPHVDTDCIRPSRSEFSDYLRAYPRAVDIAESVYTDMKVDDVCRTADGFLVRSLGIQCKHIVLASGTFTVNIPPPPLLAPLATLNSSQAPLLVVGSGFSAADVIISAPPTRRILHMFQWAPEKRSSPLRACHHTAYPEYATIYRQMKLSSTSVTKNRIAKSPPARRKSNPFAATRDWGLYEGLPNAEIVSIAGVGGNGTSMVSIRLTSGDIVTCEVGGLAYVVGRRGTLDFLSPHLRSEVLRSTGHNLPASKGSSLISSQTLRAKAEVSLEVARDVFIIGSLAGDSLIRYAVGGCVYVAGRILGDAPVDFSPSITPSPTSSTPRSSSPASEALEYLDATEADKVVATSRKPRTGASTPSELSNGHAELHLNRRDLGRRVEAAHAANQMWFDSGWWAGGPGANTTSG